MLPKEFGNEDEEGEAPPHPCCSLSPPELYSYTEEPELSLNRRCFEEDFHTQGTSCGLSTPGPSGKPLAGGFVPFAVPDRRWLELDRAQHKAFVMHLLDGLEVVSRDKRLRVARAILYLAQGKDVALVAGCDH